ncbi:MAG: thiol-disulfide isomerase/thioredoxin [Mariniblastus sp.]
MGAGHNIYFDQIYELRFGSFATQATDVPYSDWVATLAPASKMVAGSNSQPGSEMTFGSGSPLIGTAPKSFTVPMVDGQSFSLKSQVGKVVVLDFWATWCGPCVKALPQMEDAIANFSTDEVAFLAINLEEDVDASKEFLKARVLNIPVGLDSGEISKQFDVTSVPQTVIIDPQGKIAFLGVGNSNDLEEKLKNAIEELIEKDKATPQ